ncbi:MAG: hypothetical protein JSS95_14265 [Acidobacteria bacterium]|nr:hypothetical protein [Acidobacteriota bacterium]
MRIQTTAVLVAALLAGPSVLARGKKEVLPPYVLTAKTVSVVIDPASGISPEDPLANQTARKDVEKALANWGRFEPMLTGQPADLIIVVRRGQKHLVNETMPDPRQNDRAGVINPSDDGVQLGGKHGQPVNTDPVGATQQGATPSMQTEIGPQEDSFAVYNGTLAHPLEAPPAWRYMAPGALRPHSVPAVDEFRKAVAAAEKAAQTKP